MKKFPHILLFTYSLQPSQIQSLFDQTKTRAEPSTYAKGHLPHLLTYIILFQQSRGYGVSRTNGSGIATSRHAASEWYPTIIFMLS